MDISEERIRILFGLKLRQYRQEKGWSQAEFSQQSKLSVSYLNEIEKGKKYPKPAKMIQLANTLGKSYEQLVSLKATPELELVDEVLKAPIWREFPLETFGIQLNDLAALVTQAPKKANAFISTLIDLIRRHHVSREEFNLTAVRSFLELQGNYFEDLEQLAAELHENLPQNDPHALCDTLKSMLVNRFNYQIEVLDTKGNPELAHLRSIYIHKATKKLLLHPKLDPHQQSFIFGRELAFNLLEIKERPTTFTWTQVRSFDEMINNARASYFAGALLLPEEKLLPDIGRFLALKKWDGNLLLDLMHKHSDSPETFMYRLTNLLPKHFGLNNLFFLRFSSIKGSEQYALNKELHLSKLHGAYKHAGDEHYCKRWVALRCLDHSLLTNKESIDAQLSIYPNGSKYFVFSIAKATEDPNISNSFSIGLAYDRSLHSKVAFSKDTNIPSVYVGESCETCPIDDCELRQATAIEIEKAKKLEAINLAISKLGLKV